MAVYNDPVDSSSSKRKANGHPDAPAPKKANTNTFVPRASGERYQGTAARSPSNSRSVLKRRPLTQQRARDNNAVKVDGLSSLGNSKMVPQQTLKDVTSMELDISSSLGRKRPAENDVAGGTSKRQRLDGLRKAGKTVTDTHVLSKPAPKTNFFNSLYPKGSNIKASAGVSAVCIVGYR